MPQMIAYSILVSGDLIKSAKPLGNAGFLSRIFLVNGNTIDKIKATKIKLHKKREASNLK